MTPKSDYNSDLVLALMSLIDMHSLSSQLDRTELKKYYSHDVFAKLFITLNGSFADA